MAKEVTLAIRKAISASLPPELQEARVSYARWRAEKNRAKWRVDQEARSERRRRVSELLLTGHTQAEIAHALSCGKSLVTETVAEFFPFAHAGADNRYVAIRLSPGLLAGLDALAGDMLLSRSRALELIATAALEEGAAVARRTLKVVRRSSI